MKDHSFDKRCLANNPVGKHQVGKDLEARVVKDNIKPATIKRLDMLPYPDGIVFENIPHL